MQILSSARPSEAACSDLGVVCCCFQRSSDRSRRDGGNIPDGGCLPLLNQNSDLIDKQKEKLSNFFLFACSALVPWTNQLVIAKMRNLCD